MSEIFASRSYRRSRGAYSAQCMFEYLVQLLAADVFLAKLLTNLGLTDSMTGVVTSLISSAFITELASIPLLSRVRSMKRAVMISDALSISLFALAYALPRFELGAKINTILAFVCVGGGFMFKYVFYSMYFMWANSYVAPEKRATYSAGKEMVSLAAGIAFSLLAGRMFDHYEQAGDIKSCFTLISVLIIGINVISIVCFALIEKDRPVNRERKPFKLILKNTLGNRPFLYTIIMICLWRFTEYLLLGFLGTYKTEQLGLSTTKAQLLNILGLAVWFCVSLPIGKYSDKTSYARGMRLSMEIGALAYLAGMFMSPDFPWLLIVHTVLYYISVSGTGQNTLNIAYSYVDEEYITEAMAIKDVISGAVVLLASLVGGKVLSFVQARGSMVLGTKMYGQQLLSAMSLFTAVLSIAFNMLVVEKQKVVKK